MTKMEIDRKLMEITARMERREDVRAEVALVAAEISPILNQRDPIWEELSQKTICGCIYAILHDKTARPLSSNKLRDIIGVALMRLNGLK